jgi:hypothetical protein
MLGSLPGNFARIEVESGKNSGSIGNVWPCGDRRYISEPTDKYIGVLAHLSSFCLILRSHIGGNPRSRVQWSAYRLAIL